MMMSRTTIKSGHDTMRSSQELGNATSTCDSDGEATIRYDHDIRIFGHARNMCNDGEWSH